MIKARRIFSNFQSWAHKHFVKRIMQKDGEQATRWRHQMETFSALLAICAGNSPVPGEFPTQRPVTQSFDVNFDLRPNKRLIWVNNGEAGDLRRNRAHYDVIVMVCPFLPTQP